MALGIGLATLRSDKGSGDDSFGLVALCSVGPILSVLLLGLFYSPSADAVQAATPTAANTREAVALFIHALPHYAKEMLTAIGPIVAVFAVFQLATRRFHGRQIWRTLCGFLFTYLGLVVFLTGVNIGFMPAGQLIGQELASGPYQYLLIPIGALVGYFIVAAEPAVHVLKKQVEEVSNGAITQQSISLGLSIGVAISVGIAMLRILTGISILWFLIPGYALSLIMSFLVPPIYTGIAFDSGGVASGPMTATFLLPLAMGACEALGGNLMADAFGIVAMVAMTPLITIQTLGLYSEIKRKAAIRSVVSMLDNVEQVLYTTTLKGRWADMANPALDPAKIVISIVERGQGNHICHLWLDCGIPLHYQCIGHGTATSDMMDMLGLGSSEKDVLIRHRSAQRCRPPLAELNKSLGDNGRGKGKGIVFPLSP